MIGRDAPSIPSVAIICGVHSVSILFLSAWNGSADAGCMIRGPALLPRCPVPRRRLNEGLDELMAETDDTVGAHIAADHPVRQARLKRLIDNAAIGREVGLATLHEFRQRNFLRHASPLRLQRAHHRPVDPFNLPHSLASVAAILLRHPRACRLRPRRKSSRNACLPIGAYGYRSPSQAASCGKGLPWMPILRITSGCALTTGRVRHLAQQGVEPCARPAASSGLTHASTPSTAGAGRGLPRKGFVVDSWFGTIPDRVQLFGRGGNDCSAVLRRAGSRVATPDHALLGLIADPVDPTIRVLVLSSGRYDIAPSARLAIGPCMRRIPGENYFERRGLPQTSPFKRSSVQSSAQHSIRRDDLRMDGMAKT